MRLRCSFAIPESPSKICSRVSMRRFGWRAKRTSTPTRSTDSRLWLGRDRLAEGSLLPTIDGADGVPVRRLRLVGEASDAERRRHAVWPSSTSDWSSRLTSLSRRARRGSSTSVERMPEVPFVAFTLREFLTATARRCAPLSGGCTAKWRGRGRVSPDPTGVWPPSPSLAGSGHGSLTECSSSR